MQRDVTQRADRAGARQRLQIRHGPGVGAHVGALQPRAAIAERGDGTDPALGDGDQPLQAARGRLAHVDVRIGPVAGAARQQRRQGRRDIGVQVEAGADRNARMLGAYGAQQLNSGLSSASVMQAPCRLR